MKSLENQIDLDPKLVPRELVKSVRAGIGDSNLVFTNGCFDILHRGHIEYLLKARNLGDFLWVGINSDHSVSKLKGPNRPINSEGDRARLISALEFVDFVTIFEEDTPIELIRLVAPKIHCKGGDYDPESLPETPVVRSLGGRVEILPFLPGKSTTNTLKKLEESLGI
jgi:glycerol-3-phosphate cytidylyltransferase